jgi:hypothetical protein
MATAVFIIQAGRGTRRDVAYAVKECGRTVIEERMVLTITIEHLHKRPRGLGVVPWAHA